jgi:FkbM family methyltransferase
MASAQEKVFIFNLLRGIDDPVIVELGAHLGEEEFWIRGCCKEQPHYIMVEPDTRNLHHIRKNMLNYKHILYAGAISDKNGECDFHLCENIHEPHMWAHASGSIHKPTGHLSKFPFIKFDNTVIVKTFTLDEIFAENNLSKIDLLWVDIQGAEKEMIAGGQNALKYTRYIFMEAEYEEMYEGEALKQELITMLPDFTLIGDFDFNIVLRNTLWQNH